MRASSLWTAENPSPLRRFPVTVQSSDMLFRHRDTTATIDRRTSDLLERIQRIEAQQAALRAEIVGAVHGAPVIGGALEQFAQAMRAKLPRGRSGGIARARSAWRYLDGSFMPECEKDEAYREEYERFAAGGRARAETALRHSDGIFARSCVHPEK